MHLPYLVHLPRHSFSGPRINRGVYRNLAFPASRLTSNKTTLPSQSVHETNPNVSPLAPFASTHLFCPPDTNDGDRHDHKPDGPTKPRPVRHRWLHRRHMCGQLVVLYVPHRSRPEHRLSRPVLMLLGTLRPHVSCYPPTVVQLLRRHVVGPHLRDHRIRRPHPVVRKPVGRDRVPHPDHMPDHCTGIHDGRHISLPHSHRQCLRLGVLQNPCRVVSQNRKYFGTDSQRS